MVHDDDQPAAATRTRGFGCELKANLVQEAVPCPIEQRLAGLTVLFDGHPYRPQARGSPKVLQCVVCALEPTSNVETKM